MNVVRGSKANVEILCLPSPIPPDTTYLDSMATDTTFYTDGLDTIFEITDTIIVLDTTTEDSIYGKFASNSTKIKFKDYAPEYMAKEYSGTDIGVSLGWKPKAINQGLFGINLEGFFQPSTLPNDGSQEYAWQWLVDLSPEVLRFPSGGSSAFMHLLHNTDETDAIGYGYDIYEIADYYNWSNHDMDDLADAAAADGWTIEQEIFSDDPDELDDWMKLDYTDNYIKYLTKYNTQQCETRRYIDDFIELVTQINEGNPGRPAVKVIMCLNILSETATECRAIADYLRAHDVNVVAVEMGNETYADFYCDVMGFRFCKLHPFDAEINPDGFSGNYWDYINGSNYSGAAHSGLVNILRTEMQYVDAHNYIKAFKTGGGYNYKTGLVGKPLQGNTYAFRFGEEISPCDVETSACCDANDDWNSDLYSLYPETISTKKKFDAVILHTYYSPDSWKSLVLPELGIFDDCDETDADPLNDKWHFDFTDSRLEDAFEGIIGYGNLSGNFKNFITGTAADELSYKLSFDGYDDKLFFNLSATNPDKKELWVTEFNLKDKMSNFVDDDVTPDDDFDPDKVRVYDNSFVHGYLLMQWLLKNVKINQDNDYRSNFFTYATIQGFAGGVETDLLTRANALEKTEQGVYECPYIDDCLADCLYDVDPKDPNKRNYYMRRTSYFVEDLYGTIFRNNLKYLPSTYFITGNINTAPTVFIDHNNEYLYIYFTNVKPVTQNYSLDPDLLVNLFLPTPTSVSFGSATLTYLSGGSQLYSTSGKTPLYADEINACYTDYGNHPTDEMQEIIYDEANVPSCIVTPTGNACLSAPPYTIGYFKISITPEVRLNYFLESSNPKLNIYPNPAYDKLYITRESSGLDYSENTIDIKILNGQGNIILSESTNLGEAINIANLAAGFYIVEIKDSINNITHKNLIKIL